MTRVFPKDCSRLGFCMRQVRPWFEAQGIDWTRFVREGIPASELLAIDSEHARRAVAEAERREASDGK